MKCEACKKEIENPMIVDEININPEMLKGKVFCDDECLSFFITNNVKPEILRGTKIEYTTKQEK